LKGKHAPFDKKSYKSKGLYLFLHVLECDSVLYIQQYATKLSDIKSRSKASKHKSGMWKQDTSEHQVQVQDPGTPKEGSHTEELSAPGRSSGEKMPKGNLVLLRKKLEENRYR
jgi:hypothetical protein